jgi:hypothetical protein
MNRQIVNGLRRARILAGHIGIIIKLTRMCLFMLVFPCFGGSPSAQPLPSSAPQAGQGNVQAVEDADKGRKQAAASNTILTSPFGVTNPQKTTPKSLLGSN